MPGMSDDEIEVLAIVVAHDAPMRFAELGQAIYGSSCTLDHAASRARARGLRLVEQGLLSYTGRYGAVASTERGRITLALHMLRHPDVETRFFGPPAPDDVAACAKPVRPTRRGRAARA